MIFFQFVHYIQFTQDASVSKKLNSNIALKKNSDGSFSLRLDKLIIFNIRDEVQKGKTIALYKKNDSYLTIGVIEKVNENDKGVLIGFKTLKKVWIALKIMKALFTNIELMIFDENFLKKLILLNNSINKAPVLLSIDKNKEAVILNYSDTHHRFFINSKIETRIWLDFEAELDRLKALVNKLIKTNRLKELPALIDEGNEILERQFGGAGIPMNELEPSRVIYQLIPGENVFIPFEFFKFKPLLITLIPGKLLKENENFNKRFTMIYSNKLKYALKESKYITESVNKRFDLEIFCDENFEEYQTDIGKSGLIHYAGHGEVKNGLGYLSINNRLMDKFLYAGGIRLAALNCCHVGNTTKGIIKSLLDEGARFVMASPYEIPDENGYDFRKFYNHLNPRDIETSYYLSSIMDKRLYYFYRLFSIYSNKNQG